MCEGVGEKRPGLSQRSNGLTQLVLGVDRDSEIVAPIFDEGNQAVKSMIASVINVAKATGKRIGICGQAPSDYPDFTKFLVEQGIDRGDGGRFIATFEIVMASTTTGLIE